MATYDLRRGAALGLDAEGLDRLSILRRTVDFSTINAGAGAAIGDVIQLFDVPAGYMVLRGFIDVETVHAGTGTVNLSDSLLAATGPTSLGITAGSAQAVYNADSVVTTTVGTAAIADAVVEFGVILVQLDKQAALR